MSRNIKDFLLVNGVALALGVLLLVAVGCGSGIGNPENRPTYGADPLALPILPPSFQAPIDEYNASQAPTETDGVECGSFTELSSSGDVDIGRTCIREAKEACHPARYLLNQALSDGSQFVSFVSVTATCKLSVHTVSSDITRFYGDDTKTCSSLSFDEQIELACGIGQ